MIDSRYLVHLPMLAKLAAAVGLLGLPGVFLWLVFAHIGREGYSDWVMVAMSVVQIALTAIAVLAVVAFGRTDLSVREYQQRTRHFLLEFLPAELGRISAPDGGALRVRSVEGIIDIFGARYVLSDASRDVARVWIGLNVDRLIVIYFVDIEDQARVQDAFAESLAGAQDVDYDEPHYQAVDGYTSVWITKRKGLENLLVSPQKQLFLAQDVAMMTQSMVRSAARAGLSLVASKAPGPI